MFFGIIESIWIQISKNQILEEIENFTADVSHELKNPLASLKSSSELLVNKKIMQAPIVADITAKKPPNNHPNKYPPDTVSNHAPGIEKTTATI